MSVAQHLSLSLLDAYFSFTSRHPTPRYLDISIAAASSEAQVHRTTHHAQGGRESQMHRLFTVKL